MNLSQAVLEYDAMTFAQTDVHVVIGCGLLLDMHVHTACPLAESLPNGHAVHAPLPFTALNVPAAHAVHGTSPAGPVYPGTHAHALTELLPTTDCVRFGQAVQLGAPPALAKVLAGHGAHPVEPFAAAKLPVLQFVQFTLPRTLL